MTDKPNQKGDKGFSASGENLLDVIAVKINGEQVEIQPRDNWALSFFVPTNLLKNKDVTITLVTRYISVSFSGEYEQDYLFLK